MIIKSSNQARAIVILAIGAVFLFPDDPSKSIFIGIWAFFLGVSLICDAIENLKDQNNAKR